MRVASIDVGTNTALLLIADFENGQLIEIQQYRRVVRLGQGLEESGVICQPALQRFRGALEEYKAFSSDAKVDRTVITGTSASREAANTHELNRLSESVLGIPYQIISGEEEAYLTFVAAVSKGQKNVTVLDIGGGSTEIVAGSSMPDGVTIHCAHSHKIGSVRLTERIHPSQPPSENEIDAMREIVRSEILTSAECVTPTLVAVGGTATTLGLLAHELTHRDHDRSNLRLGRSRAKEVFDWLKSSSYETILAYDRSLMEGRADVLPAGALIFFEVMNMFAYDEVVVSFRGVRHGAAMLAAGNDFDGTIKIPLSVLRPNS